MEEFSQPLFSTQEMREFDLMPTPSQMERDMRELEGKSFTEPDLVQIRVEHQVRPIPDLSVGRGFPDLNHLSSSLESDLGFGNLGDSEGSISNMFANPDLQNARQLTLPGTTLSLLGQELEQKPYVPTALNKEAVLEKEAVPILENWAGDWNFQVIPTPDPSKNNKKCLYSDTAKKLFCDINAAAPFKISLDFGKAGPLLNDLIIRVQLVYTDSGLLTVPVQRCSSDMMKEERASDETNAFRARHVVRPAPTCTDVMYEHDEATQKCFLLAPVKAPERGLEYMMRSFTFACRNSCLRESSSPSTSKTLANTRGLALMFILFHNSGEVLGRQSVNMRICSAPKRDFTKEEAAIKNPQPSTSSGKRKSSGGEELASSSKAIRHVVTVPAGIKGEDEEENVSCSQDSIFSCTEDGSRIRFKNVVKDMAWLLKQKSSPRPELRQYAELMFQNLRMGKLLADTARKLDMPPIEEDKSPDGGYHEGQQ